MFIMISLKVVILLIQSFMNWNYTPIPQNPKIEIARKLEMDQCILGYLIVNDEVICHTLELPYILNIKDVSSIPTGNYTGFVREDGNRGYRIQLDDIANRDNIQIHIGNYTHQTSGCTLIGMEADNCTILKSRKARNILKKKLGPLVNQDIEVVYSGVSKLDYMK